MHGSGNAAKVYRGEGHTDMLGAKYGTTIHTRPHCPYCGFSYAKNSGKGVGMCGRCKRAIERGWNIKEPRDHIKAEERAKPNIELHTKDEGDFVFWWLRMDGVVTERYTAENVEQAIVSAKLELTSRGLPVEVAESLQVREG